MIKGRVVILSTKNANGVIKRWNDTLYTADKGDERILTHHLYLITDDEIKEGDWCIGKHLTTHYQINGITEETKGLEEWWSKIVATTNPDLYTGGIVRLTRTGDIASVKMARIPNDFIEAYVREQGKIKEVMLEYEEYTPYVSHETSLDETEQHRLKLRSNGTVIIHPVKKKAYFREDLLQAIKTFCERHPLQRGIQIAHYQIEEFLNQHYPE